MQGIKFRPPLRCPSHLEEMSRNTAKYLGRHYQVLATVFQSSVCSDMCPHSRPCAMWNVSERWQWSVQMFEVGHCLQALFEKNESYMQFLNDSSTRLRVIYFDATLFMKRARACFINPPTEMNTRAQKRKCGFNRLYRVIGGNAA
jgi:hypothetical protein